MSDDMEGSYSPFPGSFAESIMGAQGGPSFGVWNEGSDMLATHPAAKKGAGPGERIEWSVRYKQYDLSKDADVEDLERTLTRVRNNPMRMRVRQERLANDKDGYTIVTLSWEEGTVVKTKKKKKTRRDADGKPYALQQQYPHSEIPDGEYPGTGVDSPHAMPPPGSSLSSVEDEIQDAFTDNTEPDDAD